MSELTHVLFVVDKSGSMYGKTADVLGGYLKFTKELADDEANEYRLTTILFNTGATNFVVDQDVRLALPLTPETYQAEGNTALLDAVGNAVEALTEKVATPDAPYGTDRVLVVIQTDGEENSSHQYTHAMIRDMIKAREAAGNWTFTMVGEGIDTWAQAGKMGFARGNVANYNAGQTAPMMAAVAASVTGMTNSGAMSSTDYFDQFSQVDVSGNLQLNQSVSSNPMVPGEGANSIVSNVAITYPEPSE